MQRLAPVIFGTLALASFALAAQAQTPPPAPTAPAGSPAAQMTTCSNQAMKNAQANPGMPVAGSTHPTTDANGAMDDCRQKDNGAPGSTATGR